MDALQRMKDRFNSLEACILGNLKKVALLITGRIRTEAESEVTNAQTR